jgi:hypothetical protein
LRFSWRATRFFRRSTSTPWRTLSVRKRRSGNCCLFIQAGGQRHKSRGSPSGRSHVAHARSNTQRTGAQSPHDRIGAVSSHVARENGQIEGSQIHSRLFRRGDQGVAPGKAPSRCIGCGWFGFALFQPFPHGEFQPRLEFLLLDRIRRRNLIIG